MENDRQTDNSAYPHGKRVDGTADSGQHDAGEMADGVRMDGEGKLRSPEGCHEHGEGLGHLRRDHLRRAPRGGRGPGNNGRQ